MKKLLTLFLICVLLCLPILILGSCNNKSPDTPPSNEPSDTEQPGDTPIDSENPPAESGEIVDPGTPIAPEILLAENGTPLYRVIRSDFASETEKDMAMEVRKAIGAVIGTKPDIETDWEDQNDNADIKEILIGKTNRKESAEAIKSLGATEYTIRVVGNKVVIAGATNALLRRAVSEFLSDYIGYISEENYTPAATLTLHDNLCLTSSFDRSKNITLYVTDEEPEYVDALYDSLLGLCDSLTIMNIWDDPKDVFDINTAGIVLVAGAGRMANTTVAAINEYLDVGGRIIMLGGPAYETVLYEVDGEWIDYEEYLLLSNNSGKTTTVLDTSDSSVASRLTRQANNSSGGYRWSIGDYGLENSDGQLFHEVDALNGWDTVTYSLNYEKGNYSTIALYAKPGDDHTTGIYFELHEEGGVRWIAGIDFVSDDWAYYILTPNDFTWYKDGSAAKADVPDLNKILKIQFGFAGQAAVQTQGHHSYYIADVSFCSPTIATPKLTELTLDGVAPLYEQYPITNAANIQTYDNQVYLQERDYTLPSGLVSCNPGRQGLGYDNERTSRFVPLLTITDEKGLHSGYAAWMHIYSSTSTQNGNREGAIVAYFGATSEDFYDENGIAAICDVVKVMTRNIFLVEGGTDEFIYVAEDTEEITAGISYVTHSGADTSGLVASVTLYKGNMVVTEFSSETTAPVALKNNIDTIRGVYNLSDGQPDRAVATLSINGEIIDRIEHEIDFWVAKPVSERSYVYIENGMYMKDGQPITFFGVNYMPSYGIAEPDNSLFEHYACAAAYDPDVVYNDLLHIKDIGMNAVSLFIHSKSLECNNILHLITMCEEMGIYVDLAFRGTYPLKNYDEALTERFVKQLHFDENDNIIAYDIAWEERLGTYEGHYSTNYDRYVGRDIWDAAFTEWAKVQYGSMENAQKAWGADLPLNSDGTFRVDDSVLIGNNSRYAKAIAAYYRFLDDQVAKEMNDEILHLKSLAPNQSISFRLSWAGSTLAGNPTEGLFDYQSLAPVLDFLSPEGYALGASENRALQVTFANAYARYTQPNSPVVWKEFGKSCWSGNNDGNFNPSASALKASADYYEYTLKYCLGSYTSGMYAWYYAGGYRVNENSDYGIINPDGSDRQITKLLREYASLFINQGARPEADVLIEVERDDHIKTIYGMFEAVLPELREAVREGKFVNFVHSEQDEFNTFPYADEVYTESVGDTEKVGTYPLRYVNGMVKSFTTYTENGTTYAKILVCNTKQSVWRADTVSLVSVDTGDIELSITIDHDVGYLENVELFVPIEGKGVLDLRFEINGVRFGPLYSANIQ